MTTTADCRLPVGVIKTGFHTAVLLERLPPLSGFLFGFAVNSVFRKYVLTHVYLLPQELPQVPFQLTRHLSQVLTIFWVVKSGLCK